jgi:hypothetical protein
MRKQGQRIRRRSSSTSVHRCTRFIMRSTRIRTIRPLTISEYQALVTGIPKNCPTATFTVAGQTFTAAQAVVYLQGVLNAVAATAAAKTNWKDAMAAAEQTVIQEGATVRGIRDVIATMFSNQTTVLAEFLITPRKPHKPLSTQAQAAANAKAAATRKARGTMGSVQKAGITGDVTGVTITPVTSSSTSATTSASSASTSSGSTASASTPATPPSAPSAASTTSTVSTPTVVNTAAAAGGTAPAAPSATGAVVAAPATGGTVATAPPPVPAAPQTATAAPHS